MPSFSIALTGLESDNTALNTIANNISNMSTTAYKEQTAHFSNLFYQQLGTNGAGDPIQVGAGTQVASTEANFSEGSINSTGNANDMAINGSGYFVAQGVAGTEYTRAGDFTVEKDGAMVTSDGAQVMGYPVVNGAINPNASLVPLAIPIGQVEQPKATGAFTANVNLDASAAAGSSEPVPINLYDSLGVSHSATVTLTKIGSTTWSYDIGLPNGEAAGLSANTSGTLNFDSSGKLISPSSNISGISFTGLADGAQDLNFSWNLYGTSGQPSITQVASPSTVASTTQDGYASGQYQSYSVDQSGIISALYSNGQKATVGQLAIASIVNQQGPEQVAGNAFRTTLASGDATLGIAGVGGRGLIQDEALEGSNVDVSTEFSNLIVAQRAFEANSKSITTFDTVTQEAINMIH